MKQFGSKTLGLFFVVTAVANAQLSTAAYRVLGQMDLQSSGINMLQGGSLYTPGGVALDARSGQLHVYVCDTGNSRVLAWADAASYQIGDPPGLVLGQPGPGSSGAYGIGSKGFNGPVAAAVNPSNGDLYVTDTGNNRVVRFPSPFANPTRIEPDTVYGEPDFATFSGGASPALLNGPRGVAVDAGGNLWVADAGNNRIVRFAASTLGNAAPPPADTVLGQNDFVSNAANQGGTPSASTLYLPAGLTFDAQGNLYAADFGNARVLRYAAPAGRANGVAANALWGQSSFAARTIPAQASASSLAGPNGVAVDANGNVYVAVPQDNRVLLFAPGASRGGAATLVLGQTDFTTTTPNPGAAPYTSPNTLSAPADVKVDPNGNVFLADSGNNRVVRIPAGSKSATLLWGQTDFSANGINQIKPGSIDAPYKMAIDYSQAPFALYVSDSVNNRVLVWKDSTAFRNGDPADLVIGQPTLRTAYPNVDSPSASTPSMTSLSAPAGLALNPYDGTLYVADSGNNRVLRYPRPVAQTGRITPDAVIGQLDFVSNVSAAVSASSLNSPTGLAFGTNGHLFVADTANNRLLEFPNGFGSGSSAIRVYGQSNMSSSTKPTQSTAQTLSAPRGLFLDMAGNLYVADTGSNRVVVFVDTTDAAVYGMAAAYVIGAGTLKVPVDVASDSNDNIYVSDTGDNRVLIFSSPISITGPAVVGAVGQPNATSTVANWDGSSRQATADSLYAPLGVYVDRQDTLYVGDSGNNRVLQFPKAIAGLNAASFQSGVALGGLATLIGATLAPTTATPSSGSWPIVLANRTVLVGDVLPAPLSLMSLGQVNFQVPSGASLGTQPVAVRTADTGELVAGGSILIQSVAPGLFTAGENGSGQGLIFNQDGSLNSSSNPAAAGSTVTLFGTGQGQVSPAVSDGMPSPGPPMAATVAVPTTDGKTCFSVHLSMCVAMGSGFATVKASGLAPGYVGVWQLNVTIPQGTTPGAVPLKVVIDGSSSNLVTVAVK